MKVPGIVRIMVGHNNNYNNIKSVERIPLAYHIR